MSSILPSLPLQRSPSFPSYCSENAERRQNCKDTFHKDDEREHKHWREDGQDKSLQRDLEKGVRTFFITLEKRTKLLRMQAKYF